MDPVAYFTDLSKELGAVQNRIRNLIGDAHWPSDGASKESVLRAVLRRYLPPSYTVGSGFILTPTGVSPQTDILVCDDSAPFLFRDGDFLVATADCVRAAIEVKTSLTRQELRESLVKLDRVSSLVTNRNASRPFLGMFCYEPIATAQEDILDELKGANARNVHNYEILALCFGDEQFVRFWERDPSSESCQRYDTWHAYTLPKIARGYFIHNVVEFIFPHAVQRAENMWYPEASKEGRLDAKRSRLT